MRKMELHRRFDSSWTGLGSVLTCRMPCPSTPASRQEKENQTLDSPPPLRTKLLLVVNRSKAPHYRPSPPPPPQAPPQPRPNHSERRQTHIRVNTHTHTHLPSPGNECPQPSLSHPVTSQRVESQTGAHGQRETSERVGSQNNNNSATQPTNRAPPPKHFRLCDFAGYRLRKNLVLIPPAEIAN